MKKILFLLLLVTNFVMAQDMRIAHVDSKMIFNGYSKSQSSQREYDKQVARWEQEASLLQKELESIREKLDKQSLMLSEEKKKELEADYAKKDSELKAFIAKVYGKDGALLQENEKISKPLISEIRKVINEVAMQEGYDMVLDRASGAVLFWKKEHDLTQKVLRILNSK